LFVGSSILGSYVFACATPLAGIAAVAAATLPLPHAVAVVGAVWLLNQAVGFGLLNYPWTLDTVMWGVALGAAAVIATIATTVALRRVARDSVLAVVSVGFGAAFAAYQFSLFAVALVLGGIEEFAPAIVGQILLVNLAWFGALFLAHEAGQWMGRYLHPAAQG
jgi:hypothetical protein